MAIEIPQLGKEISWDFPLPRLTTGGYLILFDLWCYCGSPPHTDVTIVNVYRSIQMADELPENTDAIRYHPIPLPGWARLLQQLAVTRLAVARSARVSKPFELAEQLGVWQRVKQRVKLSQTWKNMQRVGSVEQNFAKVVIYHIISLCGWTLQYCCRMVSEWYTWFVWKDLKLKGFLVALVGGCTGPGPGPVVGSSNM